MGRRLIIDGADFSSVAADTNILDKLGEVMRKNYTASATAGASSPVSVSLASNNTRDCVFGFDLTTVFPSSVTKVKINRKVKIVVGLSANSNGSTTYFYKNGDCTVGAYNWITTTAGDIIIPVTASRPYIYMNFEKSANSTHTIFDYLDSIEIYEESTT